MSTSAKIVCA